MAQEEFVQASNIEIEMNFDEISDGFKSLTAGVHRVKITKVESDVSSNGNAMHIYTVESLDDIGATGRIRLMLMQKTLWKYKQFLGAVTGNPEALTGTKKLNVVNLIGKQFRVKVEEKPGTKTNTDPTTGEVTTEPTTYAEITEFYKFQ